MTGDAATTSTTAHLVAHARRGGRDAFAGLVRRYERTALAVAFAACGGDAHAAGDVTQEAFLRAWQRLTALEDDAKFGPWLCRIVRNAAVDLRRRKSHADRPASDELDGGGGGIAGAVADRDAGSTDPLAEADRRETGDRIAGALDALDETSRTAVVLRYYEGLSSSAIAELLMTTPAAIDMRLSRARAALREMLGERSGNTT